MAPCQLRLPKCLLLVTVTFLLDYLVPGSRASTSWEHLSLRYGTWYRPPKSPTEALSLGYRRVNGICQTDTYHGFLYVHPHNDKSRLIFDLNDKLSGIQTAISGNMRGYNSFNQSMRVPNKEIIPPILLSKEVDSFGTQIYTITAYFKHPSLICSPLQRQAHPGKGLFIQMGYRVERQYEKIPLDSRRLSTDWKTGSCLPIMGRHYFKWLSPNLPCERLYPVFLMYNGDGQLGGFGWLFQGTPEAESANSLVNWFKLSPDFYPALFDQRILPPCMSNPDFRVFGIRVYLRDEHSMTCPPKQEDDEDNDNNNDNTNDNINVDGDNNNNNNHHHHRRNRNHNHNHMNNNERELSGMDGSSSNAGHNNRHADTGTGGKPVVKIPTNHHNKNNKNNNDNNKNTNRGGDKWDYLGPAFSVRGTNGSANTHRGDKKSGQSSAGNKKDIIVDDDKYTGGGPSAGPKPFSLLSLIAMAFLSFQLFSNSLSSSLSFISLLPSSLSVIIISTFGLTISFLSIFFSIIIDTVYLPFSPSYLSYNFCTIIASVPFIIKSISSLMLSSISTATASSLASTDETTTTTTANITSNQLKPGVYNNHKPVSFFKSFPFSKRNNLLAR